MGKRKRAALVGAALSRPANDPFGALVVAIMNAHQSQPRAPVRSTSSTNQPDGGRSRHSIAPSAVAMWRALKYQLLVRSNFFTRSFLSSQIEGFLLHGTHVVATRYSLHRSNICHAN
jgi:hypothetical protein